MKTGIVGAGAVGSIFSYFFRKMNIESVCYEKNSEVVKEIKKGLNVVINDTADVIAIDIHDRPDVLAGCGIIFLFVKSYCTADAIIDIKDKIDKDSIVVTLQNGIGNMEKVAEQIPAERIVYGSTVLGATKVDANTVRLGGMGNVVIGGDDGRAVRAVEVLLLSAGLDVQVTANPEIAVWKKTIINAGINPLGALLRIPNGMIIKNEHSLKLQQALVREAVNVANAMGIKLNADEMIEQTRSVCEKTCKNNCSMLQDETAKRRTEIDNINGMIVEYGKRNFVDTPFNEAVYLLIKAIEAAKS